jgi:hypothetical protein
MSGLDRTSWKNYLQGIVPTFNFSYHDITTPSPNEVERNIPIHPSKPQRVNHMNHLVSKSVRGGRSSTKKGKRIKIQRKTQKQKYKRNHRTQKSL